MRQRKIDRPGTRRGRRGIVLMVAGALALGLGVTGAHAVLTPGRFSRRTQPDPSVTFTPAGPVASVAVTHPVVTTGRPSPSTEPSSDPNALADGIYPTYVRAVDVNGATVTVDVIQTFFGDAAHRAAVQDGVPWRDVQFEPVYIRNENPRLRTLPVARDAHVKLMALCESPSRRIGLMELRRATTPFTDTFYYEVTVVGGSVEHIQQLIAVAGC